MTDRIHLLLVGIDGLRLDRLDPRRAPVLGALLVGGALSRMTMPEPTMSGPGWSTLLTGATIAEHGVVDNSFVGSRLAGIPDLLTRAWAADFTTTTFAAVSWPPLADPADVGPVIHRREEQRRAGVHRVVVRDGETYGYRHADAEVTTLAVAAVASAGPGAAFVYLGEVDEAGHLYGAASERYQEAIDRIDTHLGHLLAAVDLRAAAGERWLVAVTTDHGHLDEGGHGGGEPEVTASFVARRASGFRAAQWPADIAPAELCARLLADVGRTPGGQPRPASARASAAPSAVA